jgi:hypothetical protein
MSKLIQVRVCHHITFVQTVDMMDSCQSDGAIKRYTIKKVVPERTLLPHVEYTHSWTTRGHSIRKQDAPIIKFVSVTTFT